MGYYSGSGEVVGGGTSIDVFETFPYYGTHHIHQKRKTTRTRYAGVSRQTATSSTYDGWCSMNTHTFSSPSIGSYTSVNCYGTKRSSSYTQIDGSNLYELLVEDESIQANLDSGAWVGP